MPYADFTYYSTEYKGAMPEEDFDRLSRQASAYIDKVTFGRAARNRSEAIQAKIKDACCAVADVLKKKEDGGEVTSQTVGSWSKSFASSGKTLEQQQYEAAALYLGMTGLMYQGGGC
jgi:uncharacterized protein with beta-barrel porin domain